MKRFVSTVCIVTCIGLIATAFAQDSDYAKRRGKSWNAVHRSSYLSRSFQMSQ